MKRVVERKITANRTKKLTPVSAAYTRARRKLEVRKILYGNTQAIPRSPQCMDQRHRVTPIYLTSQAADVGFHDRGIGLEMYIPNVLKEHRAGHGLLAVFHEVLEQSKFPRQEFDLYAAALRCPGQ